MLESAIAAYVETLAERELDVPLRALLRARGFYDIELVHGVSEYGRDFIAKRRDDEGAARQYSLQSKAGDLHLADWRKVREQLEDIRTVPIAHPLFDASLEGIIVLVTTGGLKGDARGAADGYGATLPAPWRFELWTREGLIHMLTEHLHTALGDQARGPLLSLLGAIDQGEIDLQGLERHTRRWIPEIGQTVAPTYVLEAALIANRLQCTDRLDLACSCALGVLRAEVVAYADQAPLPPDAAANIQAAGEFFAMYAESLWARCDEAFLHPAPLVNAHAEFGFWVTYPVRCMRLTEHLALLALWQLRRGREVDDIADWVARFIHVQSGCAHPVSDRHAVSFLAPAILLADRPAIVTSWLREAVRWTADRYEGESLGLAGIDASPQQEVDYLLGDLEHITLPPRRESLVAGTLLDLAAVLELAELYDDVRHEFHAVNTVPELRHPPGGREAWMRDGDGVRHELNAPYAERFDDTAGWQTAPHHWAQAGSWPRLVGLEWEALALWGLLRERFSAPLLRELVVARRRGTDDVLSA
jgi:hypothetical protein